MVLYKAELEYLDARIIARLAGIKK